MCRFPCSHESCLLFYFFGSILSSSSGVVHVHDYLTLTKHQRVEVSKAVYYAYHKAREAERYQDKVARQFELSLERFQEDGVQVELQLSIYLEKSRTLQSMNTPNFLIKQPDPLQPDDT